MTSKTKNIKKTKKCPQCGKEKTFSRFYKEIVLCKACTRASYVRYQQFHLLPSEKRNAILDATLIDAVNRGKAIGTAPQGFDTRAWKDIINNLFTKNKKYY